MHKLQKGRGGQFLDTVSEHWLPGGVQPFEVTVVACDAQHVDRQAKKPIQQGLLARRRTAWPTDTMSVPPQFSNGFMRGNFWLDIVGTFLHGAHTCDPALIPTFTLGQKIPCRLECGGIYFNDLVHVRDFENAHEHGWEPSETQGSTRVL